MLDAVTLVAGITLLVTGGEAMVRGAADVARGLGVPPLVIGLTIVAFGTSAPELAVNITAALRGNGAVAFGNLIGSNIANIGLILACASLVRPLAIESIVISREIPMMLLGTVATLVMGFDLLRDAEVSRFDRGDGFLLLLFFAVFLYYTVAETLRKRASDTFVQQARDHARDRREAPPLMSGFLLVAGLVGLAIGGNLTVTGAIGIAEMLGVPRNVIGLSIVAIGTSLPELTASVMAARRGETDLAVGNVVGSNIFNLLCVLGLTSTLHAVPVPPDGGFDLFAMISFSLALLLLSLSHHDIRRFEGLLLLAAYFGYGAWRFV